MKIATRYVWKETEHGYGWNLWEGCGLSIERDSTTGHWGVYEQDGSLLCLCADYRSAQRVVSRVKKLIQAQVTPSGNLDFAYVAEGKTGWVARTVEIHEDFGETFRSREEAEAYLVGVRSGCV
jgi:hypothetical protein